MLPATQIRNIISVVVSRYIRDSDAGEGKLLAAVAVLTALGRAMTGGWNLCACEGQKFLEQCKLQEAGLAQGFPGCVQQAIGVEPIAWTI